MTALDITVGCFCESSSFKQHHHQVESVFIYIAQYHHLAQGAVQSVQHVTPTVCRTLAAGEQSQK